MKALRNGWWWMLDYGYAGYWQFRAAVDRRRPEAYRSGAGRPIVVIPGIWETWQFMRPLVEKMHDAGHPVYVLAALGRNSRPIVESAAAVVDVIRHYDLRDVLLVTHSKGGLIGKYAMATLDIDQRIASMVAVSAPFAGSRYAPYLPLQSLRAFSPLDATTVLLGENLSVNSRITSIYGQFDPHIPEGSELAGARNIGLPTGGHFRILSRPEIADAVLQM
ncbi:alpha/beta hydrolase [Salinibacterium sp. G-O1]|uniref:esterase/lipase family protein n=1 Tax=Salinibacterium sp. G-O1 TaxID=3046208 RepID=UPI0024BB786A|nr:alpha/beta hydrolase [Salinibacterium sp. G-O1]MDJ0333938.1 alpha/beta hydrolase [Salinibacterium sp. G-O1]